MVEGILCKALLSHESALSGWLGTWLSTGVALDNSIHLGPYSLCITTEVFLIGLGISQCPGAVHFNIVKGNSVLDCI